MLKMVGICLLYFTKLKMKKFAFIPGKIPLLRKLTPSRHPFISHALALHAAQISPLTKAESTSSIRFFVSFNFHKTLEFYLTPNTLFKEEGFSNEQISRYQNIVSFFIF